MPFGKYQRETSRKATIPELCYPGKAYLDSQKPTGISSLWADQRDSSQWFTFWAVIVIGGVGIVLTTLGLIVSIVQTVGTFECIH
jgi:hypothetical protein